MCPRYCNVVTAAASRKSAKLRHKKLMFYFVSLCKKDCPCPTCKEMIRQVILIEQDRPADTNVYTVVMVHLMLYRIELRDFDLI